MPPITPAELAEADRLFRCGLGWSEIGRRLGRERAAVRKAVSRDGPFFGPEDDGAD